MPRLALCGGCVVEVSRSGLIRPCKPFAGAAVSSMPPLAWEIAYPPWGREGRGESMKLNVRQIGQVAVVDLTGKFTVGEGDAVLREGVFKLLQSDRKQILLNLREVPYIDSSGLGEMVACYKGAREKNGTVKLLNPSEKVNELLQITRLEEVFETYRDEETALRSF